MESLFSYFCRWKVLCVKLTKHILVSSGYPIYGFPWTNIQDDVYAWDGSTLSNTPLREVLYVSPKNHKNIFIVENYPQKIDRLP